MIKYKTSSWAARIDPIKVEKETADFVWVNGGRCKKLTQDEGYYDTWALARDAMLASAQNALDLAELGVRTATKKLEEIRNLTPPKAGANLPQVVTCRFCDGSGDGHNDRDCPFCGGHGRVNRTPTPLPGKE